MPDKQEDTGINEITSNYIGGVFSDHHEINIVSVKRHQNGSP